MISLTNAATPWTLGEMTDKDFSMAMGKVVAVIVVVVLALLIAKKFKKK
jgi:hypothetical protein